MDPNKYGLPDQKKYPMPDVEHVRSAIKFFNYVDPAREEELARAILRRMREYGMSFDDFTVGEENRFSKYIPLQHHGILGMKWGVRRYQNTDGSLTAAGKKRYGSKSVDNKLGTTIYYTESGKVTAKELKKQFGDTLVKQLTDAEIRSIGARFVNMFLFMTV